MMYPSWFIKLPFVVKMLLPVQATLIAVSHPSSTVHQKLFQNFEGALEDIYPPALRYREGYRTSFIDDELNISGPVGQRQWPIESRVRIIGLEQRSTLVIYTYPNIWSLLIIAFVLILFVFTTYSEQMSELITMFGSIFLVLIYTGVVFAVQIEAFRLKKTLQSLLDIN